MSILVILNDKTDNYLYRKSKTQLCLIMRVIVNENHLVIMMNYLGHCRCEDVDSIAQVLAGMSRRESKSRLALVMNEITGAKSSNAFYGPVASSLKINHTLSAPTTASSY